MIALPTVLPKINIYIILTVCVCILSHPSYNAHAPYYIVICHFLPLSYFSTLSYKAYDLRQKITEHEKCFDFLYKFVYNLTHAKKN